MKILIFTRKGKIKTDLKSRLGRFLGRCFLKNRPGYPSPLHASLQSSYFWGGSLLPAPSPWGLVVTHLSGDTPQLPDTNNERDFYRRTLSANTRRRVRRLLADPLALLRRSWPDARRPTGPGAGRPSGFAPCKGAVFVGSLRDLVVLGGDCRISAAHSGCGYLESERRASPVVTGEGRERVSRLPVMEIYHGKFSSQARAQPFARHPF
jgi:hypothetical protein